MVLPLDSMCSGAAQPEVISLQQRGSTISWVHTQQHIVDSCIAQDCMSWLSLGYTLHQFPCGTGVPGLCAVLAEDQLLLAESLLPRVGVLGADALIESREAAARVRAVCDLLPMLLVVDRRAWRSMLACLWLLAAGSGLGYGSASSS